MAPSDSSVLDVEVLRLRPDSRMDDALRILDAGARLQARAVLVICNAQRRTDWRSASRRCAMRPGVAGREGAGRRP
jgi:hypothetical protein